MVAVAILDISELYANRGAVCIRHQQDANTSGCCFFFFLKQHFVRQLYRYKNHTGVRIDQYEKKKSCQQAILYFIF